MAIVYQCRICGRPFYCANCGTMEERAFHCLICGCAYNTKCPHCGALKEHLIPDPRSDPS